MADENSSDSPLNELIAQFLEAVQQGRTPDRERLLAENPDLADELKAFFADHDGLLDVAAEAAPSAGSDPAETQDTLANDSNTPARPSPIPQGGSDGNTQFGDFELLQEIARGGMGVVYKARQVSLNRIVAVKMILAGQLAGEKEIRRFYSEARAAANLDHPGIVPIYEVGEQHGQHFFSMAFVDGESLARRVAEGPVAADEAARLLMLIAVAISHAHENGVIHRDLKPANVLLDEQGQPRITDFGLAKIVESDSDLTSTGQILGTPIYMAPEQALGEVDRVSELSDVYSMGAMLYALLTGRPPFQADNPVATIMQVAKQEPVAPHLLSPGISPDLETICLRCLEKDARRRYTSAQDLADDLGRFLEGKPIHARPVGQLERAIRWSRRNPWLARLSAAVILLAICSTVAAIALGQMAGALGEAVESVNQAKRSAERQASLAMKSLGETRQARDAEADARAKAVKAEALAKDERDRAQELAKRANEAEELAKNEAQRATKLAKRATESEALAKDEAQRANEEAETARQVSHFLVNLFEGSDPFGIQGFVSEEAQARRASLTARELLDRGAETITSELQDQPLAQAHLFDTIGNVYRAMAVEHEQAGKLLSEALEIRRELLPEDDVQIADSLQHLAQWQLAQGQFATAQSLLESALKIRLDAYGPQHDLVLTTRLNLIWVLSSTGQWEAADAHTDQMIKALASILTADAPELATALTVFDFEFNVPGGLERLPVIVDLITKFAKLPREDIQAMVALARRYVLAYTFDNLERMQGVFDEALVESERILGEDNWIQPPLLVLSARLEAMRRQDPTRARRQAVEGERIARKVIGDTHPYSGLMFGGLAQTYHLLQDFEEAERLYLEAIEVARSPLITSSPAEEQRTYLDSHPKWITAATVNLGRVNRDRGDFERADGFFRDALDLRREKVGEKDDFVVWALNEWASSELLAGDVDGYRHTCELLLDDFADTADPTIAERVAWVCTLLPEVGDMSKALRLAELAAGEHPREAASSATLGAVLYRLGRYDEAIERLRRAQELNGKSGPWWNWAFLAMAHQQVGNRQEARECFDRVRQATAESAGGPNTLGRPGTHAWESQLDLRALREECQFLLEAQDP